MPNIKTNVCEMLNMHLYSSMLKATMAAMNALVKRRTLLVVHNNK